VRVVGDIHLQRPIIINSSLIRCEARHQAIWFSCTLCATRELVPGAGGGGGIYCQPTHALDVRSRINCLQSVGHAICVLPLLNWLSGGRECQTILLSKTLKRTIDSNVGGDGTYLSLCADPHVGRKYCIHSVTVSLAIWQKWHLAFDGCETLCSAGQGGEV